MILLPGFSLFTLGAEALAGLDVEQPGVLLLIVARAASHGRFYCYRNEFLAHGSEELGITNREHTLRLCEELSDHTLLSSFYMVFVLR